jgi:hypothetical protein
MFHCFLLQDLNSDWILQTNKKTIPQVHKYKGHIYFPYVNTHVYISYV